MDTLNLTKEWDKTFPKSDKVEHNKVTFINRYGITLAADMYKPKGTTAHLPAIAICGPFGAVKEQAAGLYAQEMAKRGFLTIAFDPSFTGESGGSPRYMTSPDINTEDFCAAIDYLVTNHDVDPEKVGIIGICGWGDSSVRNLFREENQARSLEAPLAGRLLIWVYQSDSPQCVGPIVLCEIYFAFQCCRLNRNIRLMLHGSCRTWWKQQWP